MSSTRNLLMEATAISEAGATWGNMGQSLQDEDRYETDVPEEANWRTRAQQFRTQKTNLYKLSDSTGQRIGVNTEMRNEDRRT